jgi:hypothetical protein
VKTSPTIVTSVSDPDPIRIQGFDDQKLKKIGTGIQLKKVDIFFIKLAIYLSLGFHKVRPSLQPSKDNIQHFKI